jgi:dihydropteroate synthase
MSSKTMGTFQLTAQGKIWKLDTPQVLGIVNCTPDSFFSGNRFSANDEAVAQGLKMLESGANALDIGGQSTRPNATEVDAMEEWKRIEFVIAGILKEQPEAILSVDTFHSEVAARALDSGAFMINDVFAGTKDEELVHVVSARRAPLVIMHMQGTPATMQVNPRYANASEDIITWLQQRSVDLKSQGIDQLVVDPGFGFGKTTEHNFQILRSLKAFQVLGHPLLVGVSRKSMIWKTLQSSPEAALNGTTALHAWALEGGANILRVHDVKEALETVALHHELRNA